MDIVFLNSNLPIVPSFHAILVTVVLGFSLKLCFYTVIIRRKIGAGGVSSNRTVSFKGSAQRIEYALKTCSIHLWQVQAANCECKHSQSNLVLVEYSISSVSKSARTAAGSFTAKRRVV